MMEQRKSNLFFQGLVVFLVLVILTAIEFFIGASVGWIPVLVGLAVLKAALVLWFYMHIRSVFRPDEGDHE